MDNQFSEAETAKLITVIEMCRLEATPELLGKLKRKTDFYGVDGFILVAHIYRAWQKIVRQPSLRPQGPGWVLAVVENALKIRQPQAKPMAVAETASGASTGPSVEWQAFQNEVAILANQKRMW